MWINIPADKIFKSRLINLDHVEQITIEGKTITLLYNDPNDPRLEIDFEDTNKAEEFINELQCFMIKNKTLFWMENLKEDI